MPNLPENCPVCGKKMEKGYANSGSAGIFWTRERHKWRVPFDVESLVGGHIGWYSAGAEAYRCLNCKIVLFSYEKEQSKSEVIHLRYVEYIRKPRPHQ